MARLVWNQVGERYYETGVDRGVLYPNTGPGVPWNGLISVGENSSGGDVESFFIDGVKYLDIVGSETFQATIDAYSAPAEFAACEGNKTLSPGLFVTNQPRKTFGFSYRTLIGNDLLGTSFGYKLHIVYNATVSPRSQSSSTLDNSPNASSKQWTVNAVPPLSSTYKPTAHLVIDSTKANASKLATLEAYLYGSNTQTAALPSQATVISILA